MNELPSVQPAALRRIPQQLRDGRRDPQAGEQFRRALAQRQTDGEDAARGDADPGGTPATATPESPVTAALQRQLARSRKVPQRTDDGAPPRHIDVLA